MISIFGTSKRLVIGIATAESAPTSHTGPCMDRQAPLLGATRPPPAKPQAMQGEPLPFVAAVILTHNRCALLARCLDAVLAQFHPPGIVLVVDNASTDGTAALMRARVAAHPAAVRHVRSERNLGAAGGYRLGIQSALAETAPDWIWMMDDDGLPADRLCLARLLCAARRHKAGLAAPLVLDADAPERLAFPVRRGGRTLFGAAEVAALGPIRGFAHLFNGALVSRATFERIGLPDTRLVMRGDEVEFLHRARRAGVGIVLDTEARFLHPGSAPEIHPILFGRFHAVVPLSADKRFYTFRNRGHIFRSYGRWGLLAADVVRYGWYYLVNRRLDLHGYRRWTADTWRGVRGDFGDDGGFWPGRPDAEKIAPVPGAEMQADAGPNRAGFAGGSDS